MFINIYLNTFFFFLKLINVKKDYVYPSLFFYSFIFFVAIQKTNIKVNFSLYAGHLFCS